MDFEAEEISKFISPISRFHRLTRFNRNERDRRDDRNALGVTESIRKKHPSSKEHGFTPNVKLLLLA